MADVFSNRVEVDTSPTVQDEPDVLKIGRTRFSEHTLQGVLRKGPSSTVVTEKVITSERPNISDQLNTTTQNFGVVNFHLLDAQQSRQKLSCRSGKGKFRKFVNTISLRD